jgi:hypothetical protein
LGYNRHAQAQRFFAQGPEGGQGHRLSLRAAQHDDPLFALAEAHHFHGGHELRALSGAKPDILVLVLLEEFNLLGYLEVIEAAAGQIAGYASVPPRASTELHYHGGRDQPGWCFSSISNFNAC